MDDDDAEDGDDEEVTDERENYRIISLIFEAIPKEGEYYGNLLTK